MKLDMFIELKNVESTKALDMAEAQVIEYALSMNRFNQSKTAETLSISRGNLRTKLKTYFPGKYIKE